MALLTILSRKKKPVAEPFLRWLFEAVFDDGHVITQDQDDKCLTRTDGTGSTFTDVLEYEKTSKLIRFTLLNSNTGEIAGVELITGSFYIGHNKKAGDRNYYASPFHAHNQFFDPTKYPLKLIYFRETRAEQDQKATVQDDMSVKSKVIGTRHYVNRYFIGWETVVNGVNKQVTIAVG